VRTADDLHAVLSFFEARFGRLHGFRWKDWLDHKSSPPSSSVDPGDQVLGTGDGAMTEYQLTKTYADSAGSFVRTITLPVAGSVRVARDGAELTDGFSVDVRTGLVTFTTPPPVAAALTAGFEFDIPVRFDSDTIEVNLAAFEAGEIPSIPIIEVRV
jgi:uncharacterized protein (TIGR02217 family)